LSHVCGTEAIMRQLRDRLKLKLQLSAFSIQHSADLPSVIMTIICIWSATQWVHFYNVLFLFLWVLWWTWISRFK